MRPEARSGGLPRLLGPLTLVPKFTLFFYPINDQHSLADCGRIAARRGAVVWNLGKLATSPEV